MIGLPIEWILALIVGLCVALTVFAVYMIVERTLENRRKSLETAYLKRNRVGWYDYIRSEGMPEKGLVPMNDAEVLAVEELFRALVHNVTGEGIERRISDFANRHLAKGYRKKLKGRNWGERMNALYRIHDFGMDSLVDDCRKLSKRTITSEEHFLLLLIELRFNPDTFLEQNLQYLDTISANDSKELLFGMPDDVFENAVDRMDTLDRSVQLAVVDVIGMKLELKYVTILDKLSVHPDSEMRIRVLKAYNSLAVLPAFSMLERAAESEIWQERYQVARLLSLLPRRESALIAEKLKNDTEFLVQEKVSSYVEAFYENEVGYKEAAADIHTTSDVRIGLVGRQETEHPGGKGDD